MAAPEKTDRPVWLFGRTELIIVILLGLVSLATAFVSFEASLYGGVQQSSYTKGNCSRGAGRPERSIVTKVTTTGSARAVSATPKK